MRRFLWMPFVLALAAAGCDRNEIVNVDPDAAPGPRLPTFEALLDASLLDGWIDTAFVGFSSPASVRYLQVEDGTPVSTTRATCNSTIATNRLALQ